MIEIKDLRKSYGLSDVLDIESLAVAKGEVVGIVGNNGAGKTTLFRLILDLIKATRGVALLKDLDVSRSEGWKEYVAAYLDDTFLINFLTPDEYFEFIGGLFAKAKPEVISFVNQFEPIFNGEVLGSKKFIRDLSMGNRKKAGLVATLIGDPELVIWDEPFASLDPSTQIRVKNLIKEHSANRTFLVSSHDIDHIADVCTRVIILDKGTIVKDVRQSTTSRQELFDYFQAI